MYKYYCLNSIAKAGTDEFDADYEKTDVIDNADVILVRSAAMHDMKFGKDLKVIARAGAGVNNIPLDRCSEEGIAVFNTPGANANGVKELVIAGLLLASRDIYGGMSWIQEHKDDPDIAKDAEKAKKAFAGTELMGKSLGVIGLGAIGIRVANAAHSLGMKVYGYDPYLSVDAAWKLSRDIKHAKTVEDLYRECDYITVHVPAADSTKGMISKDAIAAMKDGVIVLNFARDILVDEEAMKEALLSGKVRKYVTDFPNPTVAAAENILILPHLGASTQESEESCASMAAKEVMNFLKNGNIKNSVNFPACDMGDKGEDARVTVFHHNVPNMIGQITTVLAKAGLNIDNMTNKSKGSYAYSMLDIPGDVPANVVSGIEGIEGVIKVRVIS